LTALRATFHFKIRELLVEPELHGLTRDAQHGRYLIRFTFPTEADQEDREQAVAVDELNERFPPRDEFPPLEEYERRRTGLTIATSGVPAVTVVRVECYFDGDVGVADFAGLEQLRDAPVFSAAKQALENADQAAREALRALLESIRVGGQHWLGPDAGSPRGLAHGELVDLDAGRTLPTRLGLEPALVIRKIKDYQVLDTARLDEAVDDVSSGDAPPMEQVLRADALYLLQDAEPPDFARAVLTAAIACELKIKTLLRERATDEQAELVAMLLKRPPRLIDLFHRPLKAVLGTSLCEADQPLYDRLGALIERRNGLAHRGAPPPDEQEARERVKAAVEVFRWLDALAQGAR
jgi:hypothetical protein